MKAGCTRYSPQQMADFECWNEWPGLSSSSSKGFTSLCRVQLFVPLGSTAPKDVSGWELQFYSQNQTILKRTPFVLGQHHFPGISQICESQNCHYRAMVLICEPQSSERFERLERQVDPCRVMTLQHSLIYLLHSLPPDMLVLKAWPQKCLKNLNLSCIHVDFHIRMKVLLMQ